MKLKIIIDKLLSNSNEFEGYVSPDNEEESLLLSAMALKEEDKVEVWGMFNSNLESITLFVVRPDGSHFCLNNDSVDLDGLKHSIENWL